MLPEIATADFLQLSRDNDEIVLVAERYVSEQVSQGKAGELGVLMVSMMAKVIRNQSVLMNSIQKVFGSTTTAPDSAASISLAIENERRARTLVLKNVPEAAYDTASSRQQSDESKVTEVLSALSVQANAISVRRVGQPVGNRPSFLMAELPSRDVVHQVLRNKRQLLQSTSLKSVYVEGSKPASGRSSSATAKALPRIDESNITMRKPRRKPKVSDGGTEPSFSDSPTANKLHDEMTRSEMFEFYWRRSPEDFALPSSFLNAPTMAEPLHEVSALSKNL